MPETENQTDFVRSIATKQTSLDGYGFRGWRYATANVKLSPNATTTQAICLDTGCTMTLIDRQFLMEQTPQVTIHQMPSPIPVRGLGSAVHNSDQYARVDIYLPGKDGRTAVISREVHIVNDLRAKMLVGIDILAPEGVTMDLQRKVAIIGSCDNMKIPLVVMTKSANQVNHVVLFKHRTVIPPQSHLAIAVIKPNLPHNHNFLFEPNCHQADASVYAHIVNHNMSEVHVQNDGEISLTIPQKSHMRQVVEYEAEDCYLAKAEDTILALTSRRP